MATRITFADVVEGPVYEVRDGEFGPIHVFDCFVMVQTEDGRTFVHKAFREVGWYRNEDGFACPNHDVRGASERFACRVDEAGVVNLSHWAPYRVRY